MRDWGQRNPDRVRASRIKRIYGLSAEELDALTRAQGGACAICRRPERQVHGRTGKVQNLAVDHDHVTGRVRGLLCIECNSLLARAGDDPVVLQAAVEYLNHVAVT